MDGCFGAKVPWCGALVTWFLGAMAPQCLGDMKPWFRGAMVHDPMGHGALVPWCRGTLVNGVMVPCGHCFPWWFEALVHGLDLTVTKTTNCDMSLRTDIDLDASLGSCAALQVPLVRTISELVVQRAGKALEGTVPSSSTGQHMATHSHCKSSLRSPPKTNGFGTGTPCPGLIANPLP
ncbi:hypothetical protein FXO38_35033 [Capsicum annuum]|nr:hypothetical protein FXO38_35033 [Capsicum annuum]